MRPMTAAAPLQKINLKGRVVQPTGGAIASRRNGGYSVVQSNHTPKATVDCVPDKANPCMNRLR
jgi:hypothetical protein